MIDHEDPKRFSETMKEEEAALNEIIDPIKPKIEDLCSFEDFIQTALHPSSIGFSPSSFIEKYEPLLKGILDTTKIVQEKSYDLGK